MTPLTYPMLFAALSLCSRGRRHPKLRDEALDLLRSLIDPVEIRPAENGFEIELVGDIAHMVEFANSQGHTKKRAALDGAVRCSVKVVAGARYQLNRLFLAFQIPQISQ